ncbi:MAG: GNAT family N-acetyltransferase [Gemmatimonadetes bacterium]|nr:GNAT family N-acetyltransferase [Gemmatimonadota bacterium]
MIRRCLARDFAHILAVINDAACAYRPVIPADRWKEPYMPEEELRDEIADGVAFWGWYENNGLVAVMGIQHVRDVTLIRHAYVRTDRQRRGIGSRLLERLRSQTRRPVLIGTWAAATWAIRFYEKHGFRVLPPELKDALLRTYWQVPERQIETSVVLADESWFANRRTAST